ncbi:MAG TPA: response regulator transcription factor [Thermoanaerobaculia bacterium]|nr:response regulator transcription factor [Thermoanaerobaculia bacterium]
MRILVVEDDPRMASILSRALRETGHAVDVARDGLQAADQATLVPYDLLVLDVLLPGIDGFAVCQRVRGAHGRMPILMVSGRSEIADRVRGLDVGADDYLPKPFALEELRARVSALLRRRDLPQQMTLTVGAIRLDRSRHTAHVGRRMVELTAKEYSLLEYLLLNRGRVVTRREIAEHVWDEHFDPFSNLIEVYVGRLRQKIDAGLEPGASFLRTRRGEGYLVEDSPQSPD